MIREIINFGIIGCGMISEWHAQAIESIPNARLLGVTDFHEPLRKAFSEKHHTKSFESAEALLQDPMIDAVSICTPSGLHASLVVSAAKAGKHIVVEKPLAITKSQIEEILEACDRYRVKVCVISQLRFSDSFRELKRAIDEGILGRLILGNLDMNYYRSQEYYDKGGWRGTWKMDGGGALMNQGIHGVDLLRCLMGPVKSVTALTRTLARKIEVEDAAAAVLEYENGALGHISATTSVYPGSPRILEICGERGSIRMQEDSIVGWSVENGTAPDFVVHPDTLKNDTSSRPGNFSIAGHTRQIADMVDAILNDRMPVVNQIDGKNSVELILGIYESSQTGKTVYFD